MYTTEINLTYIVMSQTFREQCRSAVFTTMATIQYFVLKVNFNSKVTFLHRSVIAWPVSELKCASCRRTAPDACSTKLLQHSQGIIFRLQDWQNCMHSVKMMVHELNQVRTIESSIEGAAPDDSNLALRSTPLKSKGQQQMRHVLVFTLILTNLWLNYLSAVYSMYLVTMVTSTIVSSHGNSVKHASEQCGSSLRADVTSRAETCWCCLHYELLALSKQQKIIKWAVAYLTDTTLHVQQARTVRVSPPQCMHVCTYASMTMSELIVWRL